MKGKLHEIIADIAFEKGDATRLDLLCSVGKEAEVWIEVRDSLEKVRVALREALNKCFTPLDEVFKRAIEAKSVSGQMEAPTPTDAKTKKASTPTEAAMKKAAKAAHKALKAIGTEVNEIRAKFVVPLVPKVDRAVENAQLRHQRTLVRFWLWV